MVSGFELLCLSPIETEISMSERYENFKRLAESRVNRVLKDIHSIKKLSNKSHYDYTEQDIKKIYSAIRKELDDMRESFSRGTGSFDEFRL